MASPSQASNTPLSNRYNDRYTNGILRLPSGPCNYTNLNIEGNPKCGCLRFTDRSVELNGGSNTGSWPRGFCICEHHSCFHSIRDPADGHRVIGDVSNGERVSSMTQSQSAVLQTHAYRENDIQGEFKPGRLSRESLMPDTLRWSGFIKSGSSQGSLPEIPSQCLLPSESGSKASSSQTGYRPFRGRGLDTLSHLANPHPGPPSSLSPINSRVIGENGRIMQIYHDSNGQRQLQSVTEVATPSRHSSQDAEAFDQNLADVQNGLKLMADNAQSAAITMTLRPSGEPSPAGDLLKSATLQNDSNSQSLLPKIMSLLSHVADYPTVIQSHEIRLDHLENASFGGSHSDIREEYKDMDDRILDLENKIEIIEKQQQLVQESFSGHTDNLDYPRIEALEAQIQDIQEAAPPSYARPWEVEVIFLPFGPELKGIWSSEHNMNQRSRVNSSSGDEWTQTQEFNSMAAAQARLTSHDQAVAWESIISDLNNQETAWLMAKACGLGSIVDERLRSRGLVRTIQIKGPDARDVEAAMLSAFGDLPDILAQDPFSHREHTVKIPRKLRRSLSLMYSWIPLRKVHKYASLRFLNTTEMLTPALWTAQFLYSSVAMNSRGKRRLYVTQPDSYIQSLATTASWTWQKLRQLNRVYPDADISHTPEHDALEPCWKFDERFDAPIPQASSIASYHSQSLSIRTHEDHEPLALSDNFSSQAGPDPSPDASTHSTSPQRIMPPRSPLKERKERHPFRPPHGRTTSMPSLVKSSPAQPSKRRITIFDKDVEIQSSTMKAGSPGNISATRPLNKRHRTRSPSRPGDAPRWSVGPPSPYATGSEGVGEEKSKSGNTQFAYATPFSNPTYAGELRLSGDMLDEEEEERGSTTDGDEAAEEMALSDYNEAEMQDAQGEEEWQGVQDRESEGSESCPSEYPSTQVDKIAGKLRGGFRIHVDGEEF